jgi:hypothetical protein
MKTVSLWFYLVLDEDRTILKAEFTNNIIKEIIPLLLTALLPNIEKLFSGNCKRAAETKLITTQSASTKYAEIPKFSAEMPTVTVNDNIHT